MVQTIGRHVSCVLVLVMSLFAGKALVTASWPVCDLFDTNGLFAGSTAGARSSNSAIVAVPVCEVCVGEKCVGVGGTHKSQSQSALCLCGFTRTSEHGGAD